MSESNQNQNQQEEQAAPQRNYAAGRTQKEQDQWRRHHAANSEPVENRIEEDETANPNVHLADIGTTLTSHGDGTPTIAPEYLRLAEEEAERNSDPDRENRAIARSLGRDV